MGLKEQISQGLNAGFKALGNLKETVSYKSQGLVGYVPSTGVVTRTETTYALEGIFLEYSKQEVDDIQVKPHDMKFLFEQQNLVVAPAENDRLIRTTGAVWEVISISEDPAHATWELQIRSTNG